MRLLDADSFLSLLLLLLLMVTARGQDATPCPFGCRCMDGTTLCMHTGLRAIPALASNTVQLYMQGHALGTIHNRAFATVTPNLQTLVLEDCGIDELQPGAFAGLKNLTKLDLKGNRLTQLRQGIFAGIEQVSEINLDGNDLLFIDEFTFDGLRNNLMVKMENNYNLRDISPKAFKGSVIKEMYFFNCSLSNASLESILPLQGMLNVFFLSTNRLPLNIPHTLFKGFFLLSLNLAGNGLTDVSFLHHVKADDISLEYNNIGTLNLSEFPSLRQTRIVRLSHTSSRRIDGSFFDGMSALTQLYMSHNLISTLPESLLNVFNKLERLTLEGNPMRCNCELVWFHKWLVLYGHLATAPSCTAPTAAAISDLTEDQLVCSPPSDMAILETAESASEVTLLCSAKGDPPPVITWHLPGGKSHSFHPMDRGAGATEGILQADPTGGTYTCTASNLAGNVSREIVVTAAYTSTSSGRPIDSYSCTQLTWMISTLLQLVLLVTY